MSGWSWKYPKGMTLKDLRDFVKQAERLDGDRHLVRVKRRLDGTVIDMHVVPKMIEMRRSE